MQQVIIRPYTLDDFEGLVTLQKEAFPPPFPEDLWWNRDQIAAHVKAFPEGALAAVLEGVIVGSATSLLVHFNGKPHTWEEVADNGYIIASHQPDGDSLYGIDVCVHPAYRGKGIAGALYRARQDLAIRLGLKRFVAGCRIPGYHRYASELTCEEYVRRVEAGEIRDLVLSFAMKQGLRPIQILKDYLEDDESLNNAVLVEWRNPTI
jgi:ribosomal protein S18 acetylase RimI-like enzyme